MKVKDLMSEDVLAVKPVDTKLPPNAYAATGGVR
jgi:hypothetical protein